MIYVLVMARQKKSEIEGLKKLIEELKTYRLENGISQMAIAKAVGVAFVSVNRWLNGHKLPDELHAYRIKKFLQEGKHP